VNAVLVTLWLAEYRARHTLVVTAVLVLTVEWLSLTVKFIPYTRAYEPGHAKLKTRWPLYLMGMFLVAYLPVRLELMLLANGLSFLRWCLRRGRYTRSEIVAHRIGPTWSLEPVELETPTLRQS